MDVQSMNNLSRSIQQMGDLLQNVTTQSMGFNKKLAEINVAEKVSDTGQNVDFSA